MRKISILAIVVVITINSNGQTNDQTTSQTIIPIKVTGPIVPPTAAQATFRLLNYKGKKLSDSVLVTTENSLVLYSKQRDLLVVQPDKKKDPSNQLRKNFEKAAADKRTVFDKLDKYKTTTMYYPAVEATQKEYGRILKQTEQALRNNIELPPSLTATATLKKKGSYALAEGLLIETVLLDDVKRLYQEVLALKKNYPPIHFSAPPSEELSACASCKKDKKKDEKKDEEKDESLTWKEKEFLKYETEVIQKSLQVLRSLTDAKASDVEAQKMSADMDDAIDFACNRLKNKSDILLRDYGKDISRLKIVVQTVLSVERQRQLLWHKPDTYAATMQKISDLLKLFDAFLQKQIDERNYDFVLNVPFILGMDRQSQLLGGEDNTHKYWEKILAFNRFRVFLEVDYDGKYSGCNGSWEKMQAVLDKERYVSIAPINCKYQIIPTEDDLKGVPSYHFARNSGFILNIRSGSWMKTYEDDNGNCISKHGDYSGLELRPYTPVTSFTFCDDEQDSIQFFDLHLANARDDRKGAEVFTYTQRIFQTTYNSTSPPSGDVGASVVELDEIRGLANQFHMGTPPDSLSESQMKQIYDLSNRKNELLRIVGEWEDLKKHSAIMFDAQNKNPTLIDVNAVISDVIMDDHVKFTIRMKVVHDPLKTVQQASK